MAGDIFTLDADNNAAVRTVSVNAGASETNSPVIFTTDEDGNAAVRVVGAGGGGSVDYTKVVSKTKTMPVASADNANIIYMYDGATDATYTHGYIYENKKTATYTSTVTFEAATLSSSTIACSGSDFATFVAEWGSGDITTITNGTITYDQSGGLLVFVGKDADSTTVCTFQLYTEDYQDAGFTITGTLQDGDVFSFTCSISEASATYAWTRVDVQPAPVVPDPLPDQTGQSGKFLTTDGTDASWSDTPLVNTATASNSLTILGTANTTRLSCINIGYGSSVAGNNNTAIGYGAKTYATYNTAIGHNAGVTGSGHTYSVAIGAGATVTADRAIQIGSGTNNNDNTFQVQSYNLLDTSNGIIPAERLASTTGLADGNYKLRLTISGGVPTLSFVAE